MNSVLLPNVIYQWGKQKSSTNALKIKHGEKHGTGSSMPGCNLPIHSNFPEFLNGKNTAARDFYLLFKVLSQYASWKSKCHQVDAQVQRIPYRQWFSPTSSQQAKFINAGQCAENSSSSNNETKIEILLIDTPSLSIHYKDKIGTSPWKQVLKSRWHNSNSCAL